MARTRKAIQSLNLIKYDVLIEDRDTRSDYFKISQFDGYFYGGRNAFLIAGAEVLRPGTKILVEILNKDNRTVYSAPVPSFIEGNSRLVQVEVYEDTPIGPGKIVILGCADSYTDGTPIPDEWKGKYNVRWIADVTIAPAIENRTPIRFSNTPGITVEEKFYFSPGSSTFSQSVSVPVDIQLNPKYLNVFPNGYVATIKGPNNTRFYSNQLGGNLSGSIKYYLNGQAETASINLPITRIFNKTTAEADGVVIYTDKNTPIFSGLISSSGQYTTNITPIGTIGVTSSMQIVYNDLQTQLTSTQISFAKIRLVNLATISGEINKVRLSYKPTTDPGEYVLLGDITTNVSELLTIDTGSKIAETGKFTEVIYTDYWYAATMSVAKNELNPTIPNYYNSSSLITNNNFITQCCDDLLNSVNATPKISSSNTTFENNVSYFIGTKNTNTIEIFPNNEYSLTFDALVARSSASITLNQRDYSMEVYLVPESGSSIRVLEQNPLGQLIGTVTPSPTFVKQNFETVEFNFKPKITTVGNYGLRFVVYGGFWNIANVSVKAAREPFFSSDEVDILIPNVNYRDKLLTFKAEYLDINNNSIGIHTTSLPTYFTGSALDIGNSLSLDYIDFNVAANPPHSEGRVHWVNDTQTLQVDTEVNNFMIELGHQEVIRGKNTTSGTLTKGTLVYVNGEAGQRPTFATASFDSEAGSAITVGMVAQDIAANNTGYAITHGLIRDINTTAYAPGTLLFLSSSGQFTNVVPQAPYHQVRLGFVITQATAGKIQLIINNGWEIEELHDVRITTPTGGDTLIRSGSLWINSKQLSGSYGVTGSIRVVNGGITGSVTGSLTGTFPYASLTGTPSGIISSSTQLPSGIVSSSNQVDVRNTTGIATIATTGSNSFTNTQRISGSLIVSSSTTSQITGSLSITSNGRIGSLGVGMDASGTTGRIVASEDIIAYASSDIRLKDRIERIVNSIELLNKINGVRFHWKQDEISKAVHNYGDEEELGVIAQEIEEVFPQLVQTRDTGYKAVRYDRIIPVLIEAVKEQQKQIEELKTKLDNISPE